ncbi:MAG TPA: CocE/NonD family hydrolase [Acidimicrobiales bacterium]|nr:CocE/NonD family hydrolase [Acidimicrobiales bacterium]
MLARRQAASLGAALAVAALTYPIATGPAPAAAHAGPPYTSIADSATADHTVTGLNGTTMQVRVLRPSTDSARPASGWPLVVYMAGDLKNRCANVNESSTRTSWYTRKQMAEHGFAVLSFNPRGGPANHNAGVVSTGTTDCTTGGDAKDMTEKSAGTTEDTGWDLGGPNDKGDVKALIDWAVANYTWSGCTTSCIDGDKVGLFGYGAVDGLKSLLMGVPNPPNAQYSSRVKGIVTVGYEEYTIRNLAAVSSDGTNFREVDQGLRPETPEFATGTFGWADPSVYEHTTQLLADKYLNTAVPDTTTTWLDQRTVLSDNASVDKAEEITTPVFMANAFLDDGAGTTTATLAYNKLGSANKYLYLGACGSAYSQISATSLGPCQGTNAQRLRDKVHEFLDRHVRGDTAVSVGGPVFWAVPPATSPLSSSDWGAPATDTQAQWPPASVGSGTTTLDYCLGSDGKFYDGLCSVALQPTANRTIQNVLGADNSPAAFAFCAGANTTYDAATESVSYETSAATAEYKMIGFQADISMKSNTSRLQAYVDLFTVDANNVETRVWQGSSQVVPVKRDGTAGTIYRFKFRPAGTAWTIPIGHRVRVKIAANYKRGFAQELLPAPSTDPWTITHTDANPTQFTITYDL